MERDARLYAGRLSEQDAHAEWFLTRERRGLQDVHLPELRYEPRAGP